MSPALARSRTSPSMRPRSGATERSCLGSTGCSWSSRSATCRLQAPMLIGVVFVSPDSVPAFLFHYGFLLFVLGFVVDLVGTSTGLALREKYFLRRARPVSFGLERK